MESNYDIINELGERGRLFRTCTDQPDKFEAAFGVQPLITLTPGDGDEVAWDWVDYGPAAIVTEIDDWVGRSHEWTLEEPVKSASSYNHLALGLDGRIAGATVYLVTESYGGPEEGGWWYNVFEPIACVLAHERLDTEGEAAKEAALQWVLLDHADDLEDGRIEVVREAVIGTKTTVGRQYYC